MRILAIAHLLRLEPLPRKNVRKHLSRAIAAERSQVVGDRAVVTRGVSENLFRQRKTRLRIDAVRTAQLINHQLVVSGIDNHRNALMILGGRAQHRRTADIDVLDRVVERALRMCDGLLERIQIDNKNFDRVDRVISKRLHVRRIGPMREQACMNARIKRLHAPIEYLGKTGVLRYFGHFDTVLASAALRFRRSTECQSRERAAAAQARRHRSCRKRSAAPIGGLQSS